jgi:eukaryotic-like serine/threonine-protein kinase
MARLDHPRIVRVFDVGVDGDRAFIIMELIDGGSLVERVANVGPLAPRIALDVTADLLRALHIAHSAGVVHRDIKPHNVLLCSDGTLRVTDFGIARVVDIDQDHLTRTGAVMGTWAFMAPEQRTDAKNVDVRADVYSVGATLYSLLTNLTPMDLFAADMDPRMLAEFDPAVADLIRASTRYRRDDRFASSEQMLAAVLQVRDGLPPLADDAIPLVPPRPERTAVSPVGDFVPELTRTGPSSPPGASATLAPDHLDINRGATFDPGSIDGIAVARQAPEPKRVPVAAMTAVPPGGPLDGLDGTFLPVGPDASTANTAPPASAGPGWRVLLLPAAGALLGAVLVLVLAIWVRPLIFGDAPVTTTVAPIVVTKAPEAAVPAVQEPADPTVVPEEGIATQASAADEVPAAPNPVPAPATARPAETVKKAPVADATPAATTATAPSPTAPVTTPAAVAPPTASLDHTAVTSAAVGASLLITANVQGSSAYDQVLVRYRPSGTARWESRSMFGSNGQYSARIAVDESMASGIEYFIDARASEGDLPALKSGTSRDPYRIVVE